MEGTLEQFILALRRSGVRISLSESLDALRSAELVGLGDRLILKEALSASLAKSLEEKEVFERTFNRFFSFESFEPDPPDTFRTTPDNLPTELSILAGMVMAGDAAGIAMSMADAGRAAEISSIRFFTQKGLFVQRILQNMGFDGLNHDIDRIAQEQHPNAEAVLDELTRAREEISRRARMLVERQLALFSGSDSGAEVDEEYLRGIRLSDLEERDLQKMHRIVHKLVKSLNALYSRRRKAAKRGRLDFKRTLRENVAYHGLLFDMRWKAKKIERPDIVVLCDVSRSVKAVVRFLLLFLYSLNETLMHIKTFVFCSNIVDVTEVFERSSVEDALSRILVGEGMGLHMGLTDYGEALRTFEREWLKSVTSKTTVIILGDARNNHGDPQLAVLETIYRRCRKLIWLNPEHRSQWGSGDSEMRRYLPYCHLALQCNTLKHLERVVHTLLRSSLS